jgi:hypothetical protein
MVKDIECGIHLEDAGSCFHDWIIWHRMQGVEHFFLYDNNSKQDHPMLKAARIYVEQGVVTLFDWPYIMDGPDNNKVQRVQMNHAMFAFSRRVEWLGFFDVDEFFVPSEPGEVLERHSSEMGGAYKLLTMFGESVIGRNDSCSRPFLSIKLKMRNAQHPDFAFRKGRPTIPQPQHGWPVVMNFIPRHMGVPKPLYALEPKDQERSSHHTMEWNWATACTLCTLPKNTAAPTVQNTFAENSPALPNHQPSWNLSENFI